MPALLYHTRRLAAALLLFFAGMHAAQAGLITYGFEGQADGTVLTGQYAGLHFTNATVLTAGISLNEFSFPPYAGSNVVFDDGGPIVITFDTLAQSVSGRFNYAEGLSMAAYDSAGSLLGTVNSSWLSNLADGSGDPGSTANELLAISATDDLIARIVISGSTTGASLTLDDLSVTTAAVAVPEPGTLPLLLLGVCLALLARPRRR